MAGLIAGHNILSVAFFVEFYTTDNECGMLRFFEAPETNCPVTPRHI
jgi:hypothetical protein